MVAVIGASSQPSSALRPSSSPSACFWLCRSCCASPSAMLSTSSCSFRPSARARAFHRQEVQSARSTAGLLFCPFQKRSCYSSALRERPIYDESESCESHVVHASTTMPYTYAPQVLPRDRKHHFSWNFVSGEPVKPQIIRERNSCPMFSGQLLQGVVNSTENDWNRLTQSLQNGKKGNIAAQKTLYRRGSPYASNSASTEPHYRSHEKTDVNSLMNNAAKLLKEKKFSIPDTIGNSVNSTVLPLIDPSFEEIREPEFTFGRDSTDGKSTSAAAAVVKATNSHQSDLQDKLCLFFDKVLVVDNVLVAKQVVRMLTNQYRHLVHACDTEVAKIDVKRETPVDHGEIICFSIYSGPKADFGNGKSCIWVDVLDGGGKNILLEFASFFEDPSIKKVWHNYSFDNHIIENYGLKLSGFHADTMHMARLWNSSRRSEGGYSLEALTSDPKIMSRVEMGHCLEKNLMGKISMKTIFGRKKVKKDGSEGKVIAIAPVEELQREERKPWICYSALDSISTLALYESLKNKLSNKEWYFDGIKRGNMLQFYEEYWRPFGDLLVKMETEGMLVDRAYLAEIEKVANAEQQIAGNRFRNWASRQCPDAKYMNVGSDTQLRQLFYGGTANSKDPTQMLPKEKSFKVPNIDKVIEEGKKAPTKFRTITLHGIVDNLPAEVYTATGWPSVSGDALKILAGKVSSEFDVTDDIGDLQSDGGVRGALQTMNGSVTGAEWLNCTSNIDTSAYGTAYTAFGEGRAGIVACHAIAALCQICSIDSLISNFILPLQGSDVSGKTGRIHCSLNINTETGRLSSRRPNLQNQPALEKDRYKIRQAFVAAPGNSLIVADYGQLELRILAHLAECKSMLAAFKAGGDFHSRTAMNMYTHIREAVEEKRVLLEWHPEPGQDKPPVPLLKDAFASERRKAKMLNFSIAYGKTPVGLARDWKVSVKEARKTVDLWYKERQEVLQWQEQRKEEAIKEQYVRTLLGRCRNFPSTANAASSVKGHIERAAINTPVQGSAADVAMCAMLEISSNAYLKELGWRLLLQVHDEVILEGPTESAEIARALVVECMSKPFKGKNILKVDLSVDAKCAQNWYLAK